MGLENIDYSKRSTVDWAAFTDKLAGAVSKIGTDRDKAREEIEKTYSDTVTKLNQPLNLEKQSLNKFVIDGSSQVKDKMLELKRKLYNKEISTSDYKATAAGYQENWANLAEQVKTADDRFKLYQDRSTMNAEGKIEASDAESHLMNEYLKMADLNNKKIVVGNDGSMYMQQLDSEGNQVGELIDYRDFSRPENMTLNRVDLASTVDGMIGDWKSVDVFKTLGRGGEETTTSPRLQKEYDLMKLNVAEALTSNPRMAVSILVDNGVVNSPVYYSSESEKDVLLKEKLAKEEAKYTAVGKTMTPEEKKAIEMSFIKFEKNSAGILEPVLSKDQITKANERVDKEIEIQIETKIQANAPAPYNATGGGGGGGDDKIAINAYMSSADAITQGDFSGFDTDNYTFEWKKDGSGKPYVVVDRLIKDTKGGKIVPANQTVKVYSPDGMTQYLKNTKGNVHLYHKGKDDYAKRYGDYYYKQGGQNSNTNTGDNTNINTSGY